MHITKKSILLTLAMLFIGAVSIVIGFARHAGVGSENFQIPEQAFPALAGLSSSQNFNLLHVGGEAAGGGQEGGSESFGMRAGFWLGINPTPTPTDTPTPTLTPTNTSPPGPTPTPGPIYLPLALRPIPFFDGPNEQEDNDSSEDANGPLHLNQIYLPFPDDNWDYFYFTTYTAGQITVDVTNHPLADVNGAQVLLYYQTVSPGTLVNNDLLPPYQIIYNGQPGTYYVAVYTDVSKCGPCGTPYQLEVSFP